jgi:uncharacterized membrane protein
MTLCRWKAAYALIAICLCVAATAARAESVDVTGVAADDVLNLRTEPRAGAPLAGALPPTASGIEVVRRADGWVQVRFGLQSGWAAARYLQPAMNFEKGLPSPLQCVGTEPFWSLTIDGKQAIYRTPDREAVASAIQTIEQSRNSTIVWRVRSSSGPVASAIIEARQACSDGMSDRVFPFRVNAETRGGELLSGCCDLAR